MDILYIYKNDGYDGLSLRYSLRSIDTYGINVAKVYVVGDKCTWFSDKVHHVPFIQKFDCYKEPWKNMALAIKTAIDNSDISEEFLVSMDGHFYTKPTDFDNYPIYVKNYKNRSYGYMLPEACESGGEYEMYLVVTGALLRQHNMTTYMFAPHRNMHLSKTLFNECWNSIEHMFSTYAGVEPFNWCLNYAYTKNQFDFTVVEDVKFSNNSDFIIPDSVFSTYDFKPGDKLDIFLNKLYNNKSKFEL